MVIFTVVIPTIKSSSSHFYNRCKEKKPVSVFRTYFNNTLYNSYKEYSEKRAKRPLQPLDPNTRSLQIRTVDLSRFLLLESGPPISYNPLPESGLPVPYSLPPESRPSVPYSWKLINNAMIVPYDDLKPMNVECIKYGVLY